MDFYRALITDVTKRFSLEQNNLLEFIFNNSIQHLRREPQFYSELSKIEFTDRITSNIQDGSIQVYNYELVVRINRFQYQHSFDKFTLMIKLADEFFDHEEMFIDEIELD